MTADNEIRQIEIHLPGILKLLSEHLYSDYRVALRELVQNAHDSYVRRKLEDSGTHGYAPRIDIGYDQAQNTLYFADNGSGLTRDEIIEYLATIGKGYTGELRGKLETEGRTAALELVGQFGLGLLAAFIVAESVQIVTRSYKDRDHGWKWYSDGNKSYALRKVDVPAVGTTVTLRLKKDFTGLQNYSRIKDAIMAYADFLPVPIHVCGRNEPINTMTVPWEGEGGQEQYERFLKKRFGSMDVLHVMPIELDVPSKDQAGQGLTIRGVLVIPRMSVVSIMEHGTVAVYVRRMLINAEEKDLLPSWARFIAGIIECPQLSPTVSRESLKKDRVYYAVQKALEAHILAKLIRLAKREPELWKKIVTAHNNLIKGWALASNTLFEHVCDIVTVKTSQGEITLQEYLHRTPNTIYYYNNMDGLSQAEALFEARGLPVIDARFFAEKAFLERYAAIHPGIRLERLEPGSEFIFNDVDDPDGRWSNVVQVLSDYDVVCRLTRFDPPEIPAVLIVSEDIRVARKARKTSFEKDKSDSTLVFIKDFLNRCSPDERFDKGILHINTACPIMRAIRDLSLESPFFKSVVEIIYHNARLFSGRTLSAKEILDDFIGINRNLETILAGVGMKLQTGAVLSPAVFTEIGLSASKARMIVNVCDTLGGFHSIDPELLACRVGLPVKIVKALKTHVKGRET